MKKLILIGAVVMLAACNTKEAPSADNAVVADDMNVAGDANAVVATAGPVMSLLGSSWEFTREGKAMQESIDSNGNYVTVSGAEHIDHGTYAQVDGKQCFTSAMNKEGQDCWTAPAQVEVGSSADIVSDKGEKLTVKRVAYVPRKM